MKKKTKLKIKYIAPKGSRHKKQFLDVGIDINTHDDWFYWWYYPEIDEWDNETRIKDGMLYASSHCRCRSLKAAIRKIKKWNVPKGTTFRLYSLYKNKDIIIIK